MKALLVVLGLVNAVASTTAIAQVAAPSGAANLSNASAASETDIATWLARVHQASSKRAYTGTFVVSAGAQTASAKIWHICDGTQQIERVEALTGAPRSTFRRNDQVITFYPGSKVAVAETRNTLGAFPNSLGAADASFAEHYSLKPLGQERIAGLDAEVVQLQPKDALRFGYRVWNDKKTGLLLQLQTLDAQGRVLEQSAFSEINLDAPVSMDKLAAMMARTEGYKVERPELKPTTAQAQGWSMRAQVPGFRSMGCYQRMAASADAVHGKNMVQWMFSDGLATVSLFMEPFNPRRHLNEMEVEAGGATRTLTRRVQDAWLTAVGEVPFATLTAFAQALERSK